MEAEMTALLQVGLYRSDGVFVTNIDEMKKAVEGSSYTLNVEQTIVNDGIAMIGTKTEWEACRLMEDESGRADGRWPLPSGYTMEVPTL